MTIAALLFLAGFLILIAYIVERPKELEQPQDPNQNRLRWVAIISNSCPACGFPVEIQTRFNNEWFSNDDPARCSNTDCNLKGHMKRESGELKCTIKWQNRLTLAQ